MIKTITKDMLITQIAKETGLTQKDCRKVLESFIKKVPEHLNKEKSVVIRGFGTFKSKTRSEKIARHPKTGERVVIPSHVVLTFKFTRLLNKYQ